MKQSELFVSYINATTTEVILDLKDKENIFDNVQFFNYRIDSCNLYKKDKKYFTNHITFNDKSELILSFSNITNRCTNYLYNSNDSNYMDCVDLFDESFYKKDKYTWFDEETLSIIRIFPKGYKNGYSLYVYKIKTKIKN
jgi:hypothetical protein